ncbi:hypothetical protein EVAR_68634_1 [Eumeta japonica]|uniref:Uncharacterized protein n=1 Tax=Eumeta variegata TaxID=151549 RepID=A0A4C1ZSJ6_EUMVA|nr:hypothetical protein EVAR_68634_1 [Eumeta japonica]
MPPDGQSGVYRVSAVVGYVCPLSSRINFISRQREGEPHFVRGTPLTRDKRYRAARCSSSEGRGQVPRRTVL